jgi:hypothetical protein
VGVTLGPTLVELIAVARFMRAYREEVRLARPSATVQALLFGPLAVAGRLMGYRSSYPGSSERPDDVSVAD